MTVLATGGLALKSAAVLAEGVHAGAHVGAVLVAGAAYRIAARRSLRNRRSAQRAYRIAARRSLRNRRSAQRIGDVAGLINGVMLLMAAGGLAGESLHDLRDPAALDLPRTVGLASFGLVVNLVSLGVLHHPHGQEPAHRRDLSFHALYLHMIGDAAVGLMTLGALFLVCVFGWRWADGAAGLAGAAVVAALAGQIVRGVFAANAAPKAILSPATP